MGYPGKRRLNVFSTRQNTTPLWRVIQCIDRFDPSSYLFSARDCQIQERPNTHRLCHLLHPDREIDRLVLHIIRMYWHPHSQLRPSYPTRGYYPHPPGALLRETQYHACIPFCIHTINHSLSDRLACYHSLGRLFTFELTIHKEHTLVTSGLYSIVRHPAYTGSILQSIAVLFCLFGTGSWMRECGWLGEGGVLGLFGRRKGSVIGRVAFSFLLARWTYVGYMMVRRTKTEDKVLRRQFGAQWDLWATRVPYRLIPGVI